MFSQSNLSCKSDMLTRRQYVYLTFSCRLLSLVVKSNYWGQAIPVLLGMEISFHYAAIVEGFNFVYANSTSKYFF